MKIILAGQNYFVYGGSDQVLLNEEASLLAMGHDVAPFAAKDPRNIPNRWDKYFPENTSKLVGDSISDITRSYYSISSAKEFDRLADCFNPDILHCHIYYGKLTTSFLRRAKARSIPIIQTLHEYKLVCPTYQMIANDRPCTACSDFKYYKALTKSCNRQSFIRTLHSTVEAYASLVAGSYRLVDKFIAVSNYQRETVIAMGVDPKKIVTLYNGVDMKKLPIINITGNSYAYMGRIEDVKGVWEIIMAFEKRPQLKLYVMGDGSIKTSIDQYILKAGIKNIFMLGFCDAKKKEEVLKKCKCLLIPSKANETFGLVAAEALAMGLPVICSNRGGLPEVVRDGVDSIVLDEVSDNSIGRALDLCESGVINLSEMGRLGSKRARVEFCMEKHTEGLLNIYKEFVV